MSDSAAAALAADGSAAAAGGSVSPTWTEGFAPELMQLVEAKAWKSPADVVTGYKHAQTLIGRDPASTFTIPKAEDAEAWSKVYDVLGRPKEAKDYTLTLPEKNADPKLAEWMRPTFHKLGFTNAQAKGLSEAWNQYAEQRMQEQTQATAADAQQLHKEWGAPESEGFKANVAIAQKAAQAFGVKGEEVDQLQQVLGFTRTLQLFHNIGAKLGEPGFAGGEGSGFGGMTPEKAKAEIAALKTDPAWTDSSSPKHKELMAKLKELYDHAYPEPAP